MNFAEQVECALPQFVLNGATSADHVARFFGIHTRTLRKRLRAEGTHLQKLVDQTRFGLARQLLRETELAVSEIAAALHFSDPKRLFASLPQLGWGESQAVARSPGRLGACRSRTHANGGLRYRADTTACCRAKTLAPHHTPIKREIIAVGK